MSSPVLQENSRARGLQGRLTLSPSEAASALGVAESTLRRYMAEEGLRYARVRGRVLIKVEWILDWLDVHEEKIGQQQERAVALIGRRRVGGQ